MAGECTSTGFGDQKMKEWRFYNGHTITKGSLGFILGACSSQGVDRKYRQIISDQQFNDAYDFIKPIADANRPLTDDERTSFRKLLGIADTYSFANDPIPPELDRSISARDVIRVMESVRAR